MQCRRRLQRGHLHPWQLRGGTFEGPSSRVREIPVVKISNFVGIPLDFCGWRWVSPRCTWWGHLGKFVKLAAGVMNTHSRYADGRREVSLPPMRDGWGQPELHLPADGSPHRRPVPRHFGEDAGLREPVLDSIFQTDSLPHPPPGRWGPGGGGGFSNQSGALAYSEGGGPGISFVTVRGHPAHEQRRFLGVSVGPG